MHLREDHQGILRDDGRETACGNRDVKHSSQFWDLQPLGEMSDRKLAAIIGCSVATIRKKRLERGIVSFGPVKEQYDINWDEQPLGEMTDEALAQKLNVSKSAITYQRVKRNIKAFGLQSPSREEVAARALAVQPQHAITLYKDFEIEVRIRNNRLKQRRLELGYHTQKAFAEVIGMSLFTYGDYEGMRRFPLKTDGNWKEGALKLAKFYDCAPEELFPPAILGVKNTHKEVKADLVEMQPLIEDTQPAALPNPEEVIAIEQESEFFKESLENALSNLTKKERKVITLRFGLNGQEPFTLNQVGEELCVSRERIRQLEKWALHKIEKELKRQQLERQHSEHV